MAIAGRFAVLAATAFSASGFQRPPPQLARSYLPGAPSPSAWSPSVPRKNPFPLRCCKGAPRDEPTGHRTKRSLSQKSFSPVEETALYTAFWRQCETTRKDISAPLICDTFAEALVAQFLPSETQERLRRDAGFIAARDLLACRTKFIDDVVVNWHAKAAQGSSATQVCWGTERIASNDKEEGRVRVSAQIRARERMHLISPGSRSLFSGQVWTLGRIAFSAREMSSP
jgi:hypothetical protein